MGTTYYRSYVVRAWFRGAPGPNVLRVAIEDVQSGRQVELTGRAAAELGERIAAAVGPAESDRPVPATGGLRE